MHHDQYIARHYERIFRLRGRAAVYRLPHPSNAAPAVLQLQVVAVLGATRGERQGTEITLEARIIDVLIAGVDLVHAGTLIKPAENHRIIIPPRLSWQSELILRPAPPTDGSPAWAWSDPAQTVLRIHTQKDSADTLQPPYGGVKP